MNIMFCGDSHAEDGILIATLSLLKNTSAPLHLYILTMQAEGYEAFDEQAFNLIKKIIKEKDIPKYKYFLVDHNDSKQSVNNKNLIIGGIDHHPDSNNLNNIILGKYASTCLQIYDIFKNKYSFNKEEKNLIYYATMRDSYFGKSIRYQEKDKKLKFKM